MGGRISSPIWIAGVAALLMSGIGTDLQATTGANDCLAAPNASSPRGQHWYYRNDLPNRRKCWYATQKALHRTTRASEFHAVSTAVDTPVSESPAVNAPRLPHTRILSVKPPPTSLVRALAEEPIQRSDPPLAPQENGPQESALQVGGSKPTAASSPAPATFRVATAGADSARLDAGAEALDDGGRIAERSTPTTQAGIVGTLSFAPVQMFLLLVFGLASVVFLVSLVIISQRDAASIDFQLGDERPDAQAKRGWQDDVLEACKCLWMVSAVKTGSAPRPGGRDLLQHGPKTGTQPRRSRRGRAWRTLKPRWKTLKLR